MKILILLLVSFSLQACGQVNRWPSLPVGINATTDEQLDVMSTMNEYLKCNCYAYDADGVQIKMVDLPKPNVGNTITEYDFNGIYFAEIQIKSNYEFGPEQYKRVFAHELGHLLGLDYHLPEGIMRTPLQGLPLKFILEEQSQEFFDWVKETYPEQK